MAHFYTRMPGTGPPKTMVCAVCAVYLVLVFKFSVNGFSVETKFRDIYLKKNMAYNIYLHNVYIMANIIIPNIEMA